MQVYTNKSCRQNSEHDRHSIINNNIIIVIIDINITTGLILHASVYH